MEKKIKRANTFYAQNHRKSEDVITSPKAEDQNFLDQNQFQRKKNQLKMITKTHLHELKKSRQLALQEQLKRLNSKRRLLKIFRRVYLVSMFISIAKQSDSKKIYGNHKHKVYKWLIFPEDRLKLYWDIFMMIVLIYSSIYIPFVAAFEDDVNVYNNSKYVFTAVYVTDIILLTRMCYYDEHNNLVQDQYQIIKNYLRGWFIIDALSVIPYPLFQLSKILRIKRVQQIISSSSLNQNKILDFLISQIDMKQAQFLQILFFSVIGFHYAACLWGLSIQLSRQQTPYYIDAIYWAMQTLSTTGYGDLTPTSMFEYITAILCTLSGGIFMSLVIGNLGSILEDLDAETQINEITHKFKALFDQFLILPEFKIGIQNFIHMNHRYNLTWFLKSQEWFKQLPQEFQNKILLKVSQKELLSISFFRISIPFSLKIIRYISLMRIKSGNMVWYKGDPAEEIYFLVDGLIHYKNKFGKELLQIKPGAIFGEQEFYSGRQLVKRLSQRTNYAYVKEEATFIVIKSSHFFHFLKEFPALQKYLQMLVAHRKEDMLIRYKEYEILAEKERVNQQKLELIKSANRIDVKDYETFRKHKQSIIYDTRQSNTEAILDKILKNRKSKISILFERFRKVVQMIIFANRTLETKIITTKYLSPKSSKESLLFPPVKPNQIVPVGFLIKFRQKILKKINNRKINISKQHEFQKIILHFSDPKRLNDYNLKKNSEIIQDKTKKIIIDYDPSKEIIDKLVQIKTLEKNLGLAIWLVKENEKDLDQELNSINRIFEKINLENIIKNF